MVITPHDDLTLGYLGNYVADECLEVHVLQICYSILYLQNMDYIQRYLTNIIRKAMVSFPAVLVTGARQTGKTTLLRTEFGASHDYVSLERPDIRNRALADPVGFFARTPGPLILDKIQYAPELLHYIKELIDTRRRPVQYSLNVIS